MCDRSDCDGVHYRRTQAEIDESRYCEHGVLYGNVKFFPPVGRPGENGPSDYRCKSCKHPVKAQVAILMDGDTIVIANEYLTILSITKDKNDMSLSVDLNMSDGTKRVLFPWEKVHFVSSSLGMAMTRD